MPTTLQMQVLRHGDEQIIAQTAAAATCEALWPTVDAALALLGPGTFDVVWHVESRDQKTPVAQIRIAITISEESE